MYTIFVGEKIYESEEKEKRKAIDLAKRLCKKFNIETSVFEQSNRKTLLKFVPVEDSGTIVAKIIYEK